MVASPQLVLCLLLPPGLPAGIADALGTDLTALGAAARVGSGHLFAAWPANSGFELAAVRGARAAVRRIKEEMFEARAGLHAGGPDTGAAANAMARAAADGSVLVSKAVERLIPRRFQFMELHVLDVKGESVPLYQVAEEIGAPGEFGEAPRDSVLPNFHPPALGTKQLMLGPSGSGRATALRAMRRAASPISTAAGWTGFGRCSRRPPSPFGGLGGIILAEASASGFDRWDGERVVGVLKRLHGSDRDADIIALSLGLRLNADADAPDRETAQDAWKRFLETADPSGTFLYLEDLEQASAEELALLEAISHPGIGIIATATPGTPVPRGFLAFTLPSFPAENARLAPLLLAELDALRGEAGDDAVRKAQAAPDAPRAAIEARFGLLPPDVREALAAAAVLGRSFWRFTLERLLGFEAEQALARARQGAWLTAREGSLMGADGELLFRHALHREIAEASLAPGDFRRLHSTAAGIYEQRARTAGPAAAARAAWHRAEAAS